MVRSVLGAVLAVLSVPALGTPLDDYVAAFDANYAYHLDASHTYVPANPFYVSIPGTPIGCTVHVLDMTSQAWRTAADVDPAHVLWRHWLVVFVPDVVVSDKALLLIDGGSRNTTPPTSALNILNDLETGALALVAASTGTVTADLKMVPNERIIFQDEPDPVSFPNGRTEDEIIAYTLHKYVQTGDGTWPLLLPMVKSAVRAMDTIQDYVPTVMGPSANVDHFVVTGASKRGWTTWLTAAADPRVIAIAPMVIDVLNLDIQMDHHHSIYAGLFPEWGGYSPEIKDYVDLHIMDQLEIPEAQALLKIVDPYEYRDRYASIPKLLINSSGDEFFVPDSAQFYYHDLPGEKYLRYVPNTGHGLDESVGETLLSFHASVVNGLPMPQFTWSIGSDNAIRVWTLTAPSSVKLWQATSPNRFYMHGYLEAMYGSGDIYASTPLTNQGGGLYVGQVNTPAVEWTAFFVELTFSNGGLLPDHRLTTQIHVVPDVLPYPPANDCNDNGLSDNLDILNDLAQDCNENEIPDECDLVSGASKDCNSNGIPDECDIASGTSKDCNDNKIPDECDIASGTSKDTNKNGIPDTCEPDCNNNGVPDVTDIADGTSEDCNDNGIPDACDILDGTSQDLDDNGVPDVCEDEEAPEKTGELQVTVATVGQGEVTKFPDRGGYEAGDHVVVAAKPSVNWRFAGWSGDRTSLAYELGVFVDGDIALTATFENPAPVASCTGPFQATIGESIQCDGSQSMDPLGEPLTLDWDFGDGTSASGAAPQHAYEAAGSYTITLTVTDRAGNQATAQTEAVVSGASEPAVGQGTTPVGGTPAGGTPSQEASSEETTSQEETTTTGTGGSLPFPFNLCGLIDTLSFVFLFAGLGLMRFRTGWR